VRADAAALLALTFAVDDVALNWAPTGDHTDFSHDGLKWVEWPIVEGGGAQAR
jgi:hypothetical protein